MGYSVGVIQFPQDLPHEDWRIGDPIRGSIHEVRRVANDIDYRVLTLVNDLGITTSSPDDHSMLPPAA
jgi:hypothetical protein